MKNSQTKFDLVFIFIFFFTFNGVHSQNYLNGKILNALDSLPIKLCKISANNNSQKCLSNDDGEFEIKVTGEYDSLRFKCFGYKEFSLPVKSIFNNSDIFLVPEKPVMNYVQTGDDNFLYALVADCRKNALNTPSYNSKVFYTSEANINDKSVEFAEYYFNGVFEENYIESINLKNCRVAAAPFNDKVYSSFDLTNTFRRYDLFQYCSVNTNFVQYLEMNPLQFLISDLKKRFELSIIDVSGENQEIIHLKFVPIKDVERSFYGELWVNKTTNNIIKICLRDDDLYNSIAHVDYLGNYIKSGKLYLTYLFENESGSNKMDLLLFEHSYIYDNSVVEKRLICSGLYYFYDYNNPFYQPKYNYNIDIVDYGIVGSIPFNKDFWEENKLIKIDMSCQSFLDSLDQNAFRVNIGEKSENDKGVNSTIKIRWSESKRLTINDLWGYLKVNHLTHKNFYNNRPVFDKVILKGQIFLDVNKSGDSLLATTATIIDIDETYYDLEEMSYTNCFLNVYYDLIEIKRRVIQDKLNKRITKIEEIESVYDSEMEKLDQSLQIYLSEVEGGANETELLKWNKLVIEKLGIDNSNIFNDSLHSVRIPAGNEDEYLSTAIERYNSGIANYRYRRYKQASLLFLNAIELGDKHPWLYYNLAITCYKLGNIEDACKYLKLSIEYGEVVDEKVKRSLCK